MDNNKNNKLRKIAKIFLIIFSILRFELIVPLILGIIIVKNIDEEDRKKKLSHAIFSLIFVSLVAGILLLVDYSITKDEDLKKEEKTSKESDEILIETHDLVKKYGSHVVIDHINMHVKKGTIYGFVGENGSGKTTIMRLISGLAEPTKGSFTLFGVSSKSYKINKAREHMAAIVEATSLVPTMTARDNMIFQEMYLGIKQSEDERNELLKKVHLENVGKKKVKNFSLGMRQRLGIALSLMNHPDLLMLDEPMNGLDPQGIAELRDLLIELNQKEGITILISSHILSELEKIATTYGFISHGKLLEEITTMELHQRCKKSLNIVTEKVDKVEKSLKKYSLKDFESFPNNLFKIYDSVDINDFVGYLTKEKIKLLSINSSDETVEDYYLSLIAKGGKENA